MPKNDNKPAREFILRHERFEQIITSSLRNTYTVRGPKDGAPGDELKVVLVPCNPEQGLPSYLIYQPVLRDNATLDDIIAARRKCRNKAKRFRIKLQALEMKINDSVPMDI